MKLSKLVIALVVLLSTLFPTVAKADHWIYVSRDPAYQIPGGWPEHHSWNKWYLYSIFCDDTDGDGQCEDSDRNESIGIEVYRRIIWKASDANTQAHFGAALSAWTTYEQGQDIDWHEWYDVTGQSGWAVNLEVWGLPCPGGALACVTARTFQGATPTNANRLNTAKLYVNPGANWASEAYHRSVYMHEIGHVYNLHEAYAHNGNCNPNITAIMDNSKINGSNQIISCDSITTIQQHDKNNILNEYGSGGGQCWPTNAVREGNQIKTEWYDYSQENWSMHMDYYKWNGSVWVWKGYTDQLNDVGTDFYTHQRTIYDWYPVQTAWGNGTYRVICAPWNGTTDAGGGMMGVAWTSNQVTFN